MLCAILHFCAFLHNTKRAYGATCLFYTIILVMSTYNAQFFAFNSPLRFTKHHFFAKKAMLQIKIVSFFANWEYNIISFFLNYNFLYLEVHK